MTNVWATPWEDTLTADTVAVVAERLRRLVSEGQFTYITWRADGDSEIAFQKPLAGVLGGIRLNDRSTGDDIWMDLHVRTHFYDLPDFPVGSSVRPATVHFRFSDEEVTFDCAPDSRTAGSRSITLRHMALPSTPKNLLFVEEDDIPPCPYDRLDADTVNTLAFMIERHLGNQLLMVKSTLFPGSVYRYCKLAEEDRLRYSVGERDVRLYIPVSGLPTPYITVVTPGGNIPDDAKPLIQFEQDTLTVSGYSAEGPFTISYTVMPSAIAPA